MHACVLQAWRYGGGHSVLLGSACTTVQALEDAPQTHLQLSGGKVCQQASHGPVSSQQARQAGGSLITSVAPSSS